MKLNEVFELNEEYPTKAREASWAGVKGADAYKMTFIVELETNFVDKIEDYLESIFSPEKKNSAINALYNKMSSHKILGDDPSIVKSVDLHITTKANLPNLSKKQNQDVNNKKVEIEDIPIDELNFSEIINEMFSRYNFTFGNSTDINEKVKNYIKAVKNKELKDAYKLRKTFDDTTRKNDFKIIVEREDPNEYPGADTTKFEFKNITVIKPKEVENLKKYYKWNKLKKKKKSQLAK